MTIKRKSIQKIIIIAISLSVLFPTVIAKAYDPSTYVDGGDFSNVGSSYETDWGAISWGSDRSSGGSANDLGASYPPPSNGDVRYDHWCDGFPAGDRGWSIMTNNRWWGNKVKNSSFIPNYGDYGGGYPSNIFNYGAMYYADYPMYSGGKPWYISGVYQNYMRWGIQQYYRLKPTPAMTNMSINSFNTYIANSSDSYVWASPTNSGIFYCEGEDRYPSSYGAAAQLDGAVRIGVIGITGTNGLKYCGYTDMNNGLTWWGNATDNPIWLNRTVNGDDKILSMSNIEYTHYDNDNGFTYRGLQTAMEFKAEDGVDYTFAANIQNKWRRSSLSYNYFLYNGAEKSTLKIDGQAPVYSDFAVTSDTYNSATVTLKDLHDVRGIDKTQEGCGVNTKNPSVGPYIKVYAIDDEGNKVSDGVYVTSYNVTSGDIKSTSTLDFNIDYSNPAFNNHFGKYRVYSGFQDNLNNFAATETIEINRENPEPNASLEVEKYKYKNGNVYWVNTKDEFSILTKAESHSSYSLQPNETILLAGDNMNYTSGTNYTGFISIATETGSDITQSTEKDIYLHKSVDYKATVNGNSLIASHLLKANSIANNRRYNLYSQARTYYKDQNKWYNSDIYNSGKVIAIDGVAASGIFTPNSKTWTNTNVIASFNPSDTGGSGVKQWRYRTSSDNGLTYGIWSNYIIGDTTSDILLSGQGLWKIQTEVMDNVENVGVVTSGTYQIDIENPNGIFTPNSKTWTNTNVIASFNPSDTGGSGVKQWRYRTSSDNGSTYGIWSNYIIGDTTSNITVSAESAFNRIQAEVTDIAGNIGIVTSGIYEIDKTKPVISGKTVYGWTRDDVMISLSAIDALSGMKNISLYTADGINLVNGVNAISYIEKREGINYFKVAATDVANNKSEESITVKIDKTAPTVDKVQCVDDYNKFTLNLTNIYDHELSGSKEVDFVVKRDGSQVLKRTVAVTDKSNLSQVFTKDELKKYGKYTVDIWTRDNVGNERMISELTSNILNPTNIVAKRVNIYDPREERYVTQLISGLDYVAVVDYANNGVQDIDSTVDYSIALQIDSKAFGTVKGVPIKVGETKEAKVNFTAGEENLSGVVYTGIVDFGNTLEESNENDNVCSTKKPYTEPVSDSKPPIIPPVATDGKPSFEVPIITIKIDFISDYINVVDLNSESVVDELICGETYRIKFKVKNGSSFNIKYMDIRNKTFDNIVSYDNSLIGSYTINDIGTEESKTFYTTFVVPSLGEDKVQEIKEIKGIVDYANKINENNETNNIITNRKTVLGLKVTDYRITEMVNPIKTYIYPIMYTDMPIGVKTGYNVTFRCNVKGNPDDVTATISDTNGTSYEVQHMTKVGDISSIESVYEYVLTVPINLPNGTIISSEIIATRGTTSYNFNKKNAWDGKTLTIGGNVKEDIVIYRKY